MFLFFQPWQGHTHVSDRTDGLSAKSPRSHLDTGVSPVNWRARRKIPHLITYSFSTQSQLTQLSSNRYIPHKLPNLSPHPRPSLTTLFIIAWISFRAFRLLASRLCSSFPSLHILSRSLRIRIRGSLFSLSSSASVPATMLASPAFRVDSGAFSPSPSPWPSPCFESVGSTCA